MRITKQTIKALTLWQPWASLIAKGIKTIETRGWSAPWTLWGQRIAIHAGRKSVPVYSLPPAMREKLEWQFGRSWDTSLPSGAVVATARLIGCGVVHDLRDTGSGTIAVFGAATKLYTDDMERIPSVHVDAYGDFGLGRHLWLLDQIEELETPVPARGMQKLWTLPEGVLDIA